MELPLFLLFTALLGSKSAELNFADKIISEVNLVTQKCMKQEGASTADLREAIRSGIHSAKCFLACVYEHYNALKEDGTWDLDAGISAVEEFQIEDEDLYNKLVMVIKTCHENAQITDDRCQTASLMSTCLKTKIKSLYGP